MIRGTLGAAKVRTKLDAYTFTPDVLPTVAQPLVAALDQLVQDVSIASDAG